MQLTTVFINYKPSYKKSITLKVLGTSKASGREATAICNRSKTEVLYNLQGKKCWATLSVI